MKVVNIICYYITANVVLAVVLFGFIQNRNDKIADLVVIVTVTLFAFGVMFAVPAIAAGIIGYLFSLAIRRPLLIIRKGKLLVLDNSGTTDTPDNTATKEGTVTP
jgi:hypothetical protein